MFFPAHLIHGSVASVVASYERYLWPLQTDEWVVCYSSSGYSSI